MIYTIENDLIQAQVSSKGAELISLKRKDLDLEYLWQAPDDQVWHRHSPVLFPIVGRLQGDQYQLDGQTYHMSQHGFARDQEFELIDLSPISLTFELRENDQTLAQYPFKFKLQCTFTILGSNLSVWYDIVNADDKDMYYSIGAHPAFATNLSGDRFEDYTVAFYGLGEFQRYFMNPPYLEDRVVETVINPHMDLDREWFDMDTLIFETDLQDVSLDLYNAQQHGVRVAFKEVPYVGVWTPKDGRAQFVCLEPWDGIADTTQHGGDLINKKGIKVLAPKKTSVFKYEITPF